MFNKIFIIIISIICLSGCKDKKDNYQKGTELKAKNVSFIDPLSLQSEIEKGLLPKINNRLPLNPKLIKPEKSIGKFGGTLKIGIREIKDKGLLVKTLGYENLISWNPEWTKVVPNIAQSWTVNENSTEYIFYLRKGMKWSDGHSFTADDIVFYYELLSNKEVTPNGFPSWLIVDGKPVIIKALNETTISFTFKSSYGLFLQRMATTAGGYIASTPRHYLEPYLKKNNPEVVEKALANGYHSWQHQLNVKKDFSRNIDLPTLYPWIMKDLYSPLTAKVLHAKRNPFYWKIDTQFKQLPYIDNIDFIVCKNQDEINKKVLEGEFDMSISDLPDKIYNEYHNFVIQNKYEFYTKIPSSMNNMTLEFNLNHPDPKIKKVFRDKNFRIALSYAIDREKIIKDIYNGNGIPYQLAPRPESPFYNKELATQYTEYNPVLSKKILKENGYYLNKDEILTDTEGNKISIQIIVADLFGKNWPTVIEYVKNDWKVIGIDVSSKIMNWAELDSHRNNSTHDMVVWIGTGGLEVMLNPDYYFPANGESGYAMKWMWWYKDIKDLYETEEPPEIVKKQMEYYDLLKATADTEEQNEFMSKILKISQEQFYSIGISLPGKSYGIKAINLKNIPEIMPQSWAYPTPAPTNPCQYYFE